MRCGKCKQDHQTTDEVRACYGLSPDTAVRMANFDARGPRTSSHQTPAQADESRARRSARAAYRQNPDKPHTFTTACPLCVSGMHSEVDIKHGLGVQDADQFSERQFDQAIQDAERAEDERVAQFKYERDMALIDQQVGRSQAEVIGRGVDARTARREAANTLRRTNDMIYTNIQAGYYATPSRTGNNDLDFWKVELGKGKWAGFRFVRRVVGGRPDQDISRTESVQALDAILKLGVGDSARLFGTSLGSCYRCNRHLTDETSRALGIGPECRSKGGF